MNYLNIRSVVAYIVNSEDSDSGDPLVTSMIIMGVMVVVALAIFVGLGNAMADRADQVATDINCSGSQLATSSGDFEGC